MSAHTPGPWTVEDVMGDGPIDICGPDVPGHASPNLLATAIADLGCDDFIPLEVAIANARLIAAAPELLEALRAITERLVNERNATANREGYIGDGELLPQVKAARAAVAKAEGR